jgi:hypothetical protein
LERNTQQSQPFEMMRVTLQWSNGSEGNQFAFLPATDVLCVHAIEMAHEIGRLLQLPVRRCGMPQTGSPELLMALEGIEPEK